ncbi:MAG: ABC transporter ATP-binding protein/permease [Treponema sp.]|nr:ABC transporter ATP-binding protein/permease [Treponema sp.]
MLKEFRTLFPYLRRYRLRYAIGFFFLITVDAAQVIIPQFLRQAVDIISAGGFTVRAIVIPAAAMAGLMGIVSLGRFLWRYFIHGSARRIETELRQNLFQHLLGLSWDFYQKNKIGDLMARATNDLNAVRESIGMGLVALVDGTVMAAAILVVIFVQDTRTAAWAVLPLPFITLVILLFGRASGKRFHKTYEAYSAMSDAVQETFAGVRVIKSFVKEWWFIKKFADTNDKYRDANMGLVRLFGVFFPMVTLLSGLTVLIVLLVGGIRVTEGLMSPGDLVALFRYLQMLIWPLMGAGFVVNMIQRGAVCLGRVNEVMRTVPAIRSPEKPFPVSAGNGQDRKEGFPLIEIRNLSVEYRSAADPARGNRVLENISLSIQAGTVLGIMGRTGSGKSTLIKAITRMIDPPPGTIFIKGVESAAWDLAELRKLFGVTPQDSFLFSDSIKNNIGYGVEDEKGTGDWGLGTRVFVSGLSGLPTRSDYEQEPQSLVPDPQSLLQKAASLAALEKDFPAFQAGWDTLIGERGLTLSGGQKQRTAIARSLAAILASDREILILDDSLSAVDAETEKAVLDGLFALIQEKKRSGSALTVIIISHRVSALSRADEVVVLDKGRIIEQGSPAELAARGGFYARTAALQSLNGDSL